MITTRPDWRAGHFRPQVDYRCFDCEPFRYEDGLDKVMQRVSRVTGAEIPFDIPARNVSTCRSVSVSKASLDLIERTYAADFDRFGYERGLPDLEGVTGPERMLVPTS